MEVIMSEYVVGRNAVIEYLSSDKEVDKLYVQKGDLKGSIRKILAMASQQRLLVVEVDKRKLDEMSEGRNHQGVCLLASEYEYYSLDEIIDKAKEKSNPLIIILDQITDPHNLGAIIRTAEAAGADGVIIPKRRSATVNATVHKTSAGATSYMKVCKVTNINQSIERLKAEGYWIYGADGRSSQKYTDIDYSGPVGLVIGNEGQGISSLVKKNCDQLVTIPMLGKTESLNASTSAAILIYEVLRSRDAKL